MANQALAEIRAHDKVCTERWRTTSTTMREIKHILGWSVATLIGGMASVIYLLANHAVH